MLAANFILILLLSFAVLWIGSGRKTVSKSLKLRLEAMRDSAQSIRTGAPLLDLTEGEDPGVVARLTECIARYSFSQALSRLILHAGSEATVGGVLLTSLALGLGAMLLGMVFLSAVPLLIAPMIMGALAPWALLRLKRSKRVKQFTAALPEAIDLMARSLRAGHSVGAAIEMVAEQSAEPLASEFDRVFQQQRFGLRFRDALLEMASRVPSPDLHFLVTAILVQRETGGDLTEILDRTTHVIRERVRIEGEVKVYTAQGRLTGWILSLLPVFLLLVINIMSPGYSRLLFEDPTGQRLLYGGGLCILVGAFIISRIVQIKV